VDRNFTTGGNQHEVWNRMVIGSTYFGACRNLYRRASALSGCVQPAKLTRKTNEKASGSVTGALPLQHPEAPLRLDRRQFKSLAKLQRLSKVVSGTQH
jgi:hypothetical protein